MEGLQPSRPCTLASILPGHGNPGIVYGNCSLGIVRLRARISLGNGGRVRSLQSKIETWVAVSGPSNNPLQSRHRDARLSVSDRTSIPNHRKNPAMLRPRHLLCLLALAALTLPTVAQTTPPRPTPPTRDAHTPGYVAATELPDGAIPPASADGNFILGPTHNPSPEAIEHEGIPKGTVYEFTMDSADSKLYPGIARIPDVRGTPDPSDPAKLIVTNSRPTPYTRHVAVYVPQQYVPGTAAPFIVTADGPDRLLFTVLDNLIAAHRVPAMIAISIGNGSGDAQGSERGLEYDTMSGRYAEFVESEILPLVESRYHVRLTHDPEGRATTGGSSGGSCALIMAWYHPELYHRVLTYSGTFINQQWPPNPQTPHGAWGFHESIIPNTPAKPIRLWMEVGDRDLFNPNAMRDNMHDWVQANENMARVLAAKGYHYQFSFVRNAGHVDKSVRQQTLAEALEYLWQGYGSGANGTAAH